MSVLFRFSLFAVTFLFLVGCASSQISARKEQRDKLAQTSKLYCGFINGDVYPDIDVAINLDMAKRCDSAKPSSMTTYRSPSEAVGIVYCCAIREKEEPKKPEQKSADNKPADLKPVEPKAADAKPELKDQKPEPKKDEKK